jgi:hypothetical protein
MSCLFNGSTPPSYLKKKIIKLWLTSFVFGPLEYGGEIIEALLRSLKEDLLAGVSWHAHPSLLIFSMLVRLFL